ncbi:MAG TPA: Gfo/Idh/MocA family oxidoreductase [Candidatus Limnocylindrales bacterium]|nr:Gfo/Idh/MocA family oxidoreductase [Candidatus Limnocylindrales bacterium]
MTGGVEAAGAPAAGRAPFRVGIVGCGNIAGPYARFIAANPALELVAATDLDPARAGALTVEHGGRAVATLDDLLAEPIDVVVNLTFQAEHYGVTRRALEAGRHVHSEKPLALRSEEAWELVELARARGLRLGCSPFTLMGEAQQTAWRAIRDGSIGEVRVVYAQVDWGRIESWHPAPVPFYEVGPVVDVGVYPLTMVTAMFGPVRSVRAFGRVLMPERVRKDGEPFRITTPDLWIIVLELEGGLVLRLTASFYTGQQSKGYAGLAFHGDAGSIWLDHFFRFDTAVERATLGDGEPHVAVPPVRAGAPAIDWSRAIEDMADAIATGRPHRATGEQAAHLVDVLEAIRASADRDGSPVEVTTSFERPAPMPWAR